MHQHRHASEPLRLGPFHLDLRARELRKDGRPVRLQDKPFELLIALTERPGEVITREELRQRLWPSDTFVVFDDSLNVAIRKVRDALGDTTGAPKFIQTVPRHGYRYIGPIEGNGFGPAAPTADRADAIDPPSASRAHHRLATAAIAVVAVVVLAATAWSLIVRSGAAPAPAIVRFEVNPPPSSHLTSSPRAAVSPDGRQIAFCAVSRPSLVSQIWVQTLDSSVLRPLPGTENAVDLAWSPNGKAIAFRTTTGTLKRYDLDSGGGITLADATPFPVGLDWSEGAGILYAPGRGHGLSRVTPNGGPVEQISTLDAAREETMHVWPQFLPDGRSFIYLAVSQRSEWTALYLARVGDPARRLVRAGSYRASYISPGILIYGVDGKSGMQLLAQRFDLDRLALSGDPIEVASEVMAQQAHGGLSFSVSPSGVLVYMRTLRPPRRELLWVNRAGQRIASLTTPDQFASFTLSPNGRWAVMQAPESERGGAPDLWLLDLTSGMRARVTRSPGNDEGGVWAHDSGRFVYACHPDVHRPAGICLKTVDDPERDHPLMADGNISKHPFDWSRDGRFLLYGLAQKGGAQDIWVLPLDSRLAPYSWLSTRFDESEARFSPNGRWVAYQSDETGRSEVFVRSFDPPGSRWQVSTNGGILPQWSRDGKELYFVTGDYHLAAVTVSAGSSFAADPPRPLFELRRLEANPRGPTPYAVSADGQRFLIGAIVDQGSDPRLAVVLNWSRLLQ